MGGILNPWALLAGLVAVIGLVAGAYLKGGHDARNAMTSDIAREEKIAQTAYDAAQRATAEEIAKIKIRNVTVRQELEKEIIREPSDPDCRLSGRALELLNEQLQGPPREPADSGELPADAGGPR